MPNNFPLIVVAMEETAMRAGPTINLNPMARTAIRAPHATILDWDAMKRPVKQTNERLEKKKEKEVMVHRSVTLHSNYLTNSPKLNMAMPSPPSDKSDIDLSIIIGSFKFHLQWIQLDYLVNDQV